MDVLAITKEWSVPSFEWTDKADAPNCFTKDALNFNTFIRAFTHNRLEWQWLEGKVCYYFLVDDWDTRLCDKRPDILEDSKELKRVVEKIWKYTYDVMHNIWKI